MRIIIELDTKDQAGVNVTSQPETGTAPNTLQVNAAQDIPAINAGPAPGTSADSSNSSETTTTGDTQQSTTDATSAGAAPDLTTV